MWTTSTASERLRALLDKVKAGEVRLSAKEPTSIDPCFGEDSRLDYGALYLRMWSTQGQGLQVSVGSFWLPIKDVPGSVPVTLVRAECLLWLGGLANTAPKSLAALNRDLIPALMAILTESKFTLPVSLVVRQLCWMLKP